MVLLVLFQATEMEEFYELFLKIVISFFCGFVIGIERTRVSAQYGARDHIFFSMISTSLIIFYKVFLPIFEGFILILIFFGGMIVFLLIGSIYRLFREKDIGYTTTLSMLLAMIVGIICYYNEYVFCWKKAGWALPIKAIDIDMDFSFLINHIFSFSGKMY